MTSPQYLIVNSADRNVSASVSQGDFRIDLSKGPFYGIRAAELLFAELPYVAGMAGKRFLQITIQELAQNGVRTTGNSAAASNKSPNPSTFFIPVNEGVSAVTNLVYYQSDVETQRVEFDRPLNLSSISIRLTDGTGTIVDPAAAWSFVIKLHY